MNSDLSTQRYHKVLYYNLDVIISVGYRINSLRATKFRIWSTSILKEKFGGSNLFGVEKDASLVATDFI